MKKIFLFSKPHSVQRSFFTSPPRGYASSNYLDDFDKQKIGQVYQKMKNRLSYIPFLKKMWEYSKYFYNPIKRRYLKSLSLNEKAIVNGSNFIFTTDLIATKKPYWIDIEHVSQLMGWDLRLLEKNKYWISDRLAEDNCKLITCWTKTGLQTVFDTLPQSHRFRHKAFFVYNALPSVHFKRKFEEKKEIVFLFIGSYNLPFDFIVKGGEVALEAFRLFHQEFPDSKLIIKAWVPEHIFEKYRSIPGIEFSGVSPYKEMQKFFTQADVLLFPSYNTPAQAFLDAMNYSLPIITTDVWANSEIVKNNYNGILIKKSRFVHHVIKENIPATRTPLFNKEITKLDPAMISSCVHAMKRLVDWKLRKKLGTNGKKEIERGIFSLKKRNKEYKRLFDKFFK